MNKQITNLKSNEINETKFKRSYVKNIRIGNVQISHDASGEKGGLLKSSECRHMGEGVAKSLFRLQICYMMRHMWGGGWLKTLEYRHVRRGIKLFKKKTSYDI